MESFRRHAGIAAPLFLPDIDTDQIIPVREMVGVVTDNYGAGLFANWRYLQQRVPDPGFILNQQPWTRATILIAGRNFGCGSSRELAPRALRDFGFRAIVAPSFAPIFFGNCFRNGLLPVQLPESTVEQLAEQALQGGAAFRLDIDLEAKRLTTSSRESHDFSTPVAARRLLLEGADEVEVILRQHAAIERFVAADLSKRPWVHLGPTGTAAGRGAIGAADASLGQTRKDPRD